MNGCRIWMVLQVVLALAAAGSAETTFHVAKNGDDSGPGTAARPFATLVRARDAAREIHGPRSIIVHGGTYEPAEPLSLGIEDSGSPASPVTWRAAQGERVRLVGGRTIPRSAFEPVRDPLVLRRLDPAARGQVMGARLTPLGITRLPEFPVSYHGAPPGPELFFNGKRMTLATWPNGGWATIDKILDAGARPRDGDKSGRTGTFRYSGDRPSRWNVADGVWLQGYWCYDWYDEVIKVGSIDQAAKTIRLAAPHLYGLSQGDPAPRRFRALNVLEELDEPGEYYIDRLAGVVYFWPPAPLAGSEIVLSQLDAPIIACRDASNVTIRGFMIEAGLGDGIELRGCRDCVVRGCEVRNMRHIGIRVTGGARDRVEDCDIHDTGTGGMTLEGGDRKTLTPGRHEAVGNEIWRFSIHQLTGSYGLSFGGVGNRAANNSIHDAPHQAIFVGGNDHVFEYNEVYAVCTETDDCGALYKGRNPSCRGNQMRFNYWHDIGSPMGHGNAAIYFDDGDGGDTVYGNVFFRCGEPGRAPFGSVFSHGGFDNRAENNVFIECKRALGSAPWSEQRWRAALQGGEETYYPQKLLKEVDITKPPYTTHYPELVGYMDPPPGFPRANHAKLNVLVNCGQATSGNWEFDPTQNLVLGADPGFADYAKHDFRLRRDSEVFKKLKSFKPIPFDKIGLRRTQPR